MITPRDNSYGCHLDMKRPDHKGVGGIEGILGMECTPLAMVCELG